MALDPLTAGLEAGTVVSKLAGEIIDKLWPSAEDKAKVAQAQADIQLAMLKQTTDADGAFRKFVVDYEGEGDKVSASLQWYRGSVRPTVTYGLIALFGYGFLHPETFSAERMSLLWHLNLISLGFWFGERALSNLGLDLGKLFAAKATPVK